MARRNSKTQPVKPTPDEKIDEVEKTVTEESTPKDEPKEPTVSTPALGARVTSQKVEQPGSDVFQKNITVLDALAEDTNSRKVGDKLREDQTNMINSIVNIMTIAQSGDKAVEDIRKLADWFEANCGDNQYFNAKRRYDTGFSKLGRGVKADYATLVGVLGFICERPASVSRQERAKKVNYDLVIRKLNNKSPHIIDNIKKAFGVS